MKRIDFSFVLMVTLVVLLLLTASLSAQDVADTPVPPPAPTQPIPYSHKTHLALAGMQCPICHSNPAPGNLMTYPASALCMGCHAKIAADKNKPSIQKLAEFDKTKTPVPWVRVYTAMPGTGWSHRKHLDAGVKCETCHGQVAQMDVMAKVKSVTSMGGCRDCHKSHNASTACVGCHAAWDLDMVVRK